MSIAGLLGLASPDTAAATAHPNWTIGATRSSGQVSTRTNIWGCHGHADKPHGVWLTQNRRPPLRPIRVEGIGYDAWQECWGGFDIQKVCVQLWWLDYYAHGHKVSSNQCSGYTIKERAYFGRSLKCSQIGHGWNRYYTTTVGYAYPDGVQKSRRGESDDTWLCG